MAGFWTFRRGATPAEQAMGLYGPGHLLWLLGGTLVLFLTIRNVRHSPALGRRLRRWIGLALPGVELIRVVALCLAGEFGVGWLPLHLCGLSLFLCTWHSFRDGDLAGELLYALTLPGAAMALLFPDWADLPAVNFISMVCFAFHWLLLAYPAVCLASGAIRPDARRLPRVLAVLLPVTGAVYLFDRAFSVNYFFLIQAPAGSPLAWFAAFLGTPGYLLGYLPMLALVWLLLYLPLRRKKRK